MRRKDMDKGRDLYIEIACLAYDLYEKRGKAHGYHLEDWVKAEKIVMERHASEIEAEAKTIKTARKKASGEAKPRTRKAAEKKAPKTKKKTTTRRKKTE